MLKIRECSDLHLEFYYDSYDAVGFTAENELSEILPPLQSDAESVLIVSGDIATARKPNRLVTFFKMVVPRFKHVIYILGNHEHYGMQMEQTLPTIVSALTDGLSSENFSKMTIAGNDPVRIDIDGVKFLCGTLWTDYADGAENASLVQSYISRYITDHKTITNKLNLGVMPIDLIPIHKATLKKFGFWMRGKDQSRTVICTHHMPSFQAVAAQYANSSDPITTLLNHAFTSNLDKFILKYQPAVWTFGHTHTKYFGKIGKTQLICNPLGYPNEHNLSKMEYTTANVFEV